MRPFERFKNSLTKDNLWIYILMLLKNKEMYAYELRENIHKNFGFKPGSVTAYFVLKHLKIGGYVKVTKKLKKIGPIRTYYKITKKGEKELKLAIQFKNRLNF